MECLQTGHVSVVSLSVKGGGVEGCVWNLSYVCNSCSLFANRKVQHSSTKVIQFFFFKESLMALFVYCVPLILISNRIHYFPFFYFVDVITGPGKPAASSPHLPLNNVCLHSA